MSRHRLFFALVPPDAARAELAATGADLIARHAPGGRPVPPQLLHITLAFLGEFDPDSDASARALAAASRLDLAAFELTLDTAASLPGRTPPWTLQPAHAPAELPVLQSALARELASEDFILEARAFVPHLTFLRHARIALPRTSIPAIAWPAADFVLLDSRPAEHCYLELGRWPLR